MHDRRDWSNWLDGKDELECSETATTDTGQTDHPTTAEMDDYFFQHHVRASKNVSESTSYLEIFNYSVRACVWGADTICLFSPL